MSEASTFWSAFLDGFTMRGLFSRLTLPESPARLFREPPLDQPHRPAIPNPHAQTMADNLDLLLLDLERRLAQYLQLMWESDSVRTRDKYETTLRLMRILYDPISLRRQASDLKERELADYYEVLFRTEDRAPKPPRPMKQRSARK